VSLGHYARTQVLVAGVDAVGIGLGALFLRLPFVLPLTVLVFLSSFVPIVGAIFSGAVVVLVALVAKGPVAALVMLGVVLAVQQIETHVLQPFLMGRAVALHPLAVIAAVAAGSFLLGIVGALFAVPVLAFTNSVVRYYAGDDTVPSLGTEPMRP
jgi:predicted PurR-regulated permease PerM